MASKPQRLSRAELLRLMLDLVDDDSCRYDHHGGCQAHGYLSLGKRKCPHEEAKRIIRAELPREAP